MFNVKSPPFIGILRYLNFWFNRAPSLKAMERGD